MNKAEQLIQEYVAEINRLETLKVKMISIRNSGNMETRDDAVLWFVNSMQNVEARVRESIDVMVQTVQLLFPDLTEAELMERYNKTRLMR